MAPGKVNQSDQGPQDLLGGVLAHGCLLHGLDHAPMGFLEPLVSQSLLAFPVLVNGSLGAPRPPGDVLGGGAGNALPRHELHGSVPDPGPGSGCGDGHDHPSLLEDGGE